MVPATASWGVALMMLACEFRYDSAPDVFLSCAGQGLPCAPLPHAPGGPLLAVSPPACFGSAPPAGQTGGAGGVRLRSDTAAGRAIKTARDAVSSGCQRCQGTGLRAFGG